MLESALKISNQTGPLCEQAAYTARDEYPWHECLCRYIVATLLFSPLMFKAFSHLNEFVCAFLGVFFFLESVPYALEQLDPFFNIVAARPFALA